MNIILLEDGEDFLPSSDSRANHIKKVLKLGKGEVFKAGIINGDMGYAVIEDIREDGIAITFKGEKDGSSLYPLTLLCAQVRPICMRRILREAVSLGVSRIVLPVSDLGEKSYLNASLYRDGTYKAILLDGAMQAGMTGIPETNLCASVEDAIKTISADSLFLLDNAIGAMPLSGEELKGKSVAIAIGPERGWSERERQLFLANHYKPVLIGSRILRTETAAVSAVALTLSRMGYL